jgi:protein-S-isoprenylcysteine O-methyltransferase Ste14
VTLPSPLALGAIYGISEVCLALTRRSGGRAASRDQYSLLILWGVILISIWLSVGCVVWFPNAALPDRRALYFLGLALFAGGIILRWYSIWYLGRFFTVDVAIAPEHRVIETGPYRLIRHPSYTGALLAFFGFGFCLGNWMSILCLMVPIVAAFMWRIHVEERALIEALGDNYRSYMHGTKRLLPRLY